MTFQSPLWLLALLVVAALVALLRASCSCAGRPTPRGSPTWRCSARSCPSGRAGGGTWPSASSRSAWPRWSSRWPCRAREVRVPRERATVVMAVDVSLSMQATDIEPDRFRAMQKAAKEFVDVLPERINLGLVSFAGTATTRRAADDRPARRSRNAIDNLDLAESTAIGEAIFTSLTAIENFQSTMEHGDRGAAAGPDRAALRRLQHRRPAGHPGHRRRQGGRRPGVDDRLRHRLRHARPRRRDGARAGRPGDARGRSPTRPAAATARRPAPRSSSRSTPTSAARSATRPSRRTSATGSCAAASCWR